MIHHYHTMKIATYGGKEHMLNPFSVIGDGPGILAWTLAKRPAWTEEDMTHEVTDFTYLDPGGMLCIAKENELSFQMETEFGSLTFRSFWDKLATVIDYMGFGSNHTINGVEYLRFPQMNNLLYIPVGLAEQLKDKLLELNFTPEADEQVARHKNAIREMMEEGHYGVMDQDGNLHTGPGSSGIVK